MQTSSSLGEIRPSSSHEEMQASSLAMPRRRLGTNPFVGVCGRGRLSVPWVRKGAVGLLASHSRVALSRLAGHLRVDWAVPAVEFLEDRTQRGLARVWEV
ncbi:unnamed protein product, partial [Dicrocoelium dendriticum]